MKPKSIKTLLTLAAFSIASSLVPTTQAQGPLTPPPGVPGPVMKSLDQVEARTPLIPGSPGVAFSNGKFTINQPGSYYLVSNLICSNDGTFIHLAGSFITLDLNGFSLIGTSNSAVAISGQGQGYHVRNGYIIGGTTLVNDSFIPAGFYRGIELYDQDLPTEKGGSRVSDVTVFGVEDAAITVSGNSIVTRCYVDTAGKEGISAGIVQDCRAINTGNHAIAGSSVMNSTGRSLGFGNGIRASDAVEGGTIENCNGSSVNGAGIYGVVVSNSRGKSTYSNGIECTLATGCFGQSSAGKGIVAWTALNCVANRPPGGRAIEAIVANGCGSQGGGTNFINFKYNMP